MTIGTKSVLFGAHCFFLHPFFVAAAWTKLYGFPFDPRLWVAFFVHDLFYIGKPNMDGPEGERHPEGAATLMACLFDSAEEILAINRHSWFMKPASTYWHDLVLYHSRHYAKINGAKPSQLCFADKLAFCYQFKWLYIFMTMLTGELHEYLSNAKFWNNGQYVKAGNITASQWYDDLVKWIKAWVEEFKDGREDTVTVDRRVSAEKY